MAAKKRKTPIIHYSKIKSRPGREIILFRRLLVICLLLAILGALLFGIFSGLKYAGSFLLSRNPSFALKNIEVSSDGRLSPDDLLDYSGLQVGTNIFAVEIGPLRKKFEMLALVESVTIDRKLPGTLKIRIMERTAVAQLCWSTRGLPFLLDRHGVVLPMTDSGSSLPLIEGFKPEKLQQGDCVTDPGIMQCLKILVAVDDLGLGARLSFSKFNIRSADFVTAVVNNDTTVRFPLHSAHEKLARLADSLQKVREEGRRAKTVDLIPDGRNVPVIYYE
ncbi:MAG: FtsQ-type POTRA domain-containing protein [Pontiellaceae bacterium]|jgi:cell division protein FtsQ|nr:FtsQ-type POTRA domain-containing protein [Pontiellaceae bacterium]